MREKLGLFSKRKVEFIGYWNKKSIFKSTNPNVRISYYEFKNEMALICANTSTDECSFSVESPILSKYGRKTIWRPEANLWSNQVKEDIKINPLSFVVLLLK
jgi:formylmethanofuran dehydrogenase subunit E-like metal-binding protein